MPLLPWRLAIGSFGVVDELFQFANLLARKLPVLHEMSDQRDNLAAGDMLDQHIEIAARDIGRLDHRFVTGGMESHAADQPFFHKPVQARLDRGIADLP